MKKLLSLLLSVMLLTGAALPAAAAEATADAKLTEITQSVKTTLALDTKDYSHFQGNYNEQELTPMWDLYWDGDSGSLSVTALENGTITSYYLYTNETDSSSQQGLPTFPQGDAEKAKAAAQAFLDKVLTPGVESVVLEDPDDLTSLDSSTFRFNGQILINGLPSPLSYSLTVRSSDNQVIRFWRDAPETMFLGISPTLTPRLLRPTLRQPSSPPCPCGWSTSSPTATARRRYCATSPTPVTSSTWMPRAASWWT